MMPIEWYVANGMTPEQAQAYLDEFGQPVELTPNQCTSLDLELADVLDRLGEVGVRRGE